ncbi:MAG: PAS domain S-box protein [Nitrospirae bacterium]|nr:MAG: PAS domain S-box protein [Nitrospirota bacterium]
MPIDACRKTGIEVIGEVPWGTHFCQFYKTKEDLLDLLVPYFTAGLAQNEFCMWVTSEPLTEAEAMSALRQAVPDLDRYLAKGQLEIIPYTDWYRRGGVFEADRVLRGWVEKLEQARAKGFEGLRLTGNTFWLESQEWHAFADYEQKVNSVIGQFRMMALCTYSLDKCGASEVIDVVSNHQFALIKREGRWARIQSSEQKRVEDELREREERFRTLTESLPQLIWTCLPDGRCDYLSRQWIEYTGIPEAPQLGYGWTEQLHPDDRRHVQNVWDAAVRDGNKFDVEFRIRRADGLYRWFKTRAVPLRDPSGCIVKWFGSNTDIDEQRRVEEEVRRLNAELEQRVVERTAQLQTANRKLETEIAEHERTEAALREGVARGFRQVAALIALTKRAATQHGDVMASLRRITEMSAKTLGVARVSIWRFDPARPVLRCVDLYERDVDRHSSGQELRTGDYPGYFLALSEADVIDASDAHADPRTREFSESYLTPLGIRSMMDATIRLGGVPDGVVCHEHVGPVRHWTQDEQAFAVAIANQVALRLEEWERKRLEEKHGQLAAILDSTSDFVATADGDGHVLYVNRAGRRLIGFGEDEDLTGLRIADEDQPQGPADFLQQGLPTAAREGQWSGETELLARDGRKIPVSQVVLAHKGPDGSVTLFSTIARDITDRKRAEETLRQAEQKLREILEHSTNVFYAHTPDHVLTYLSPQASALLACAPAMGQTKWTEFLTDNPVNQQGFELTQRAIDTGQAQPAYELELKAMDGRVIWVEVHEAPVVRDGKTTAIVGSLTDITERKRVEQEVRLAKERFQSLVETIGDWIWEIDRNGRYTYVSPRIQDLLGYEPADVIGRTPFELMPPDEAERVAVTFEAFLSVHAPFTGIENTNLHKDGRRIVLETSGMPVFDGNGEFLGYRGTDRDITDRKRAEEMIEASRDFYLKLLDDFPTPVWRAGLDAKCNWFNKTWLDLTGRTLEQELRDGWVEGVHPDDRARCVHDYRQAFDAHRPFVLEYRLRRHDGAYRWMMDVGQPFNDLDGTFAGYVGSCYDFTDRKQSEEEQRRLQHFLDSIIENLPDMVFVKDARDLRFVLFNRAGEALIGRSQEELIGKCDHDFFPKEQADFFAAKDRDVLAGGQLLDIPEELIQTRDKGQRILHTKKIPILDEQGVPRYLLGLSQDITERKRAEQALRESEQRFRAMVETSPDGIFINRTSVDQIIYINSGGLRLLGATKSDQVLGKSVFQFLHPTFHAIVRDRIKRYRDLHTTAPLLEETYVRLDGTPIDVEVTAVPLLYQGEEMMFVVIRDITARKEIAAQGQRLERLAAIGQLLGGLAHELRNPLFILTGHLQLFREKLLQQEYATLPADLEKIEAAAGRMSRITERFLTLARPSQPRLEPCAVPTALRQTLEFLGNELMKNQIRVDTAITSDLPLVQADPKQLQEVFLNLMMNAMQAMVKAHGKGTLRVSARLVTDTGTRGRGERRVAASPRLPVSESADTGHGEGVTRGRGDGERWIEVRIQDDGPGILPEHRLKLFDPFFTTKPPQEGTGLGLWAVRTTVMALGGTVTCESDVGQGATFIVRLPVAENSGQPSAISYQP